METYILSGLRSGYHLGGVAEKFDLPPYSEHSSALKMEASIGGRHFQLKEQFSLAAPSAILEEPFAPCLKLETPPRQTLKANWEKRRHRITSEWTLRRTLNAALVCIPKCYVSLVCMACDMS